MRKSSNILRMNEKNNSLSSLEKTYLTKIYNNPNLKILNKSIRNSYGEDEIGNLIAPKLEYSLHSPSLSSKINDNPISHYNSRNLSVISNYSNKSNSNLSTSTQKQSKSNFSFSSIRYIDDSDEASVSIASNFRRLGIESASIASVINLRNQSYLKSRENDCIDTILIQLQAIGKVNEQDEVSVHTVSKQSSMKSKISRHSKQSKNEKSAKTSKFSRLKPLFAKSQSREPAEYIFVDASLTTTDAKRKSKFCTLKRSIANVGCECIKKMTNASNSLKAVDSQSNGYLVWLAVLSAFYIYNIFSISIRYSFECDVDSSLRSKRILLDDYLLQGQGNNSNSSIMYISRVQAHLSRIRKFLDNIIAKRYYWIIIDHLADFVYLVDIFLVQTRIRFVREGLWICDFKSTSLNYMNSLKFGVII
jgi:hypothetical protein